jgi:hypothetical protein
MRVENTAEKRERERERGGGCFRRGTNLLQVFVEQKDADVKALFIDAARVERVFAV